MCGAALQRPAAGGGPLAAQPGPQGDRRVKVIVDNDLSGKFAVVKGASARMERPDAPQDSEGAQLIIEEARGAGLYPD